MPDRITRVTIRGLRTIDELSLPVDRLTVLIGENGSGKTTIVEALELLSKVPLSGEFVADHLRVWHGNFNEVLRYGAKALELGVRIEGEGGLLDYVLELAPSVDGLTGTVRREHLVDGKGVSFLQRVGNHAAHVQRQSPELPSLAMEGYGHATGNFSHQPTRTQVAAEIAFLSIAGADTCAPIQRVRDRLNALRIHLPIDVRPVWAATDAQSRALARRPMFLDTARRVERFGANLANCFNALNSGDPELRQRVLEDLRFGLGLDVVGVQTPVAARGYIDLAILIRGRSQPLYASSLSSGQLAYMAFIALARLPDPASIVAFDEPELHLHPGLLTRVSWLFQELAERVPVLLTTHSDGLLDTLQDPENQILVCQLDHQSATRLFRMETSQLQNWRSKYRGVGELRQLGLTQSVFTEPVTEKL